MRHASRPVSFLHPGGRGSSDKPAIASRTRSEVAALEPGQGALSAARDLKPIAHERACSISRMACSKGIVSPPSAFASS